MITDKSVKLTLIVLLVTLKKSEHQEKVFALRRSRGLSHQQ